MIVEGKFLEKINSDLGSELGPFELDADFMHFTLNGIKNGSGKKPFWVCGSTWEYKGNSYFILTYGDFRGGAKFQLASYDMKDQTTQFKKAHNEQVKKIEEKAAKEKSEKRLAGITKWKPRFYNCSPTSNGAGEYLSKKCIEKTYRARIDYKNTLLIPIEGLDEDNNICFEGVQMVWRDAETMQWQKRYNEGLNKRGAFTRVTEFDVKKSEFIYLCEGYATACTVFTATGIPTVCAFDSGNLDLVIEKLKILNPDVKIIICADDDFQTMIQGKQVNVGILKAISCQKKFQNVTYKKPRFSSRIDETDFNDLHILDGIDAVREQLKINRAEFTDVILLGHLEHKEFFYLSTESKSIVSLTPSQHDAKYLKAIADEKYWAEKYGYKKNPETGEIFPNWVKISDNILKKQREIGVFDPKCVRGLGVWLDDKRVLVNYGQGVYDAHKKISMSNIDPLVMSKNFYNASSGDIVNFDDELTDDESVKIGEAIRSLNFKNSHDYVFVMGFIAIANIFGALDWRPHLWITAPAGSGKSWMMKKIRDLIYFHIAFKKASVAGIEQNVGNQALAVVIDEAEASDRIDGIVELARQASTNDGGLSGKGAADGKGVMTEMNACFLMASVEPPHFTQKADESRFFIVDMNSNEDQSSDEFKLIENKFKEIEGMGQRLMVRMVNNIEMLKENVLITKNVLRLQKIPAREADQIAPIIAGFLMFFTKQKIDESLILSIMDKMSLGKSDYVERNEEKQDDRVYTALMMLQLNGLGLTIGGALKLSLEANKTHMDLEGHGMVWVPKQSALFIAATSPLLDRKMLNFKHHNFRKVLERSPNFIKKNFLQRVSWTSSGVAKGILLKVNVT